MIVLLFLAYNISGATGLGGVLGARQDHLIPHFHRHHDLHDPTGMLRRAAAGVAAHLCLPLVLFFGTRAVQGGRARSSTTWPAYRTGALAGRTGQDRGDLPGPLRPRFPQSPTSTLVTTRQRGPSPMIEEDGLQPALRRRHPRWPLHRRHLLPPVDWARRALHHGRKLLPAIETWTSRWPPLIPGAASTRPDLAQVHCAAIRRASGRGPLPDPPWARSCARRLFIIPLVWSSAGRCLELTRPPQRASTGWRPLVAGGHAAQVHPVLAPPISWTILSENYSLRMGRGGRPPAAAGGPE